MTGIAVAGCGAVSPAGWSVADLRERLASGEAIGITELPRPGWTRPLPVRRVPPNAPATAELRHPRLRRVSAISRFAVAATVEALRQAGLDAADHRRTGIVFCTTCGPVSYSRRFYGEVLQEPALASPLVFPETVFNAPGSHLSAIGNSSALNYTLVGDVGVFAQGLARAAELLAANTLDACVVVAAEEVDWLTSDVARHFARRSITAEGAGALVLTRAEDSDSPVRLAAITSPRNHLPRRPRAVCVREMAEELAGWPASRPPEPDEPAAGRAAARRVVLLDSCGPAPHHDEAENRAWSEWRGPRLAPKRLLGEGFAAAAAWQCVAAAEAVRDGADAALVSIAGLYQFAVGVGFQRQTAS